MAKQKKFVQNNNNLAIAYYRYSSHVQNEASIDQQREAAEKYAEAYGFTIMKEYVDEALTATNDDRPKFPTDVDRGGANTPRHSDRLEDGQNSQEPY